MSTSVEQAEQTPSRAEQMSTRVEQAAQTPSRAEQAEPMPSRVEPKEQGSSGSADSDPSVPCRDQEEIPTFEEWTKIMMEVENEKSQITHVSNGLHAAGKKLQQTFTNYASVECGAKILSSNPEAKSTSAILMENMDMYMLNPCNNKIWRGTHGGKLDLNHRHEDNTNEHRYQDATHDQGRGRHRDSDSGTKITPGLSLPGETPLTGENLSVGDGGGTCLKKKKKRNTKRRGKEKERWGKNKRTDYIEPTV
ncbi:hypothetical protein QQF64_014251 [Cirrhinus molitorella]|uniref:Uncharacterized protein n=1 Tax=Cirrhinus molitorella TaxID=172907 RepID=A0ABR3NST0_9TELE